MTAGTLDFTPVTDLDRAAIAAINPGRVTFPVASPQKRFARDAQAAKALTSKQRAFLWRIAWTYRRQISDESVLQEAARRRGAAFVSLKHPVGCFCGQCATGSVHDARDPRDLCSDERAR